MSEEVAASIGDVLAENARLKQQLAQAEERALMNDSGGDPWRECERLRALLAQAEERARIASAAYHQQQDATREHEARYQAMTERALAAERNAEEWKSIALTTRLTAEAWEQAAVRLDRRAEKTAAVNRELNIQALVWMERATVLERTARRLVVAWRAERQRTAEQEDQIAHLAALVVESEE